MVLADSSLRFYNFVLSLNSKIAGYVDLSFSDAYPNISDMISSCCYSDKQYAYQRLTRTADVRGPKLKDVPADVNERQRRVLVPKKWTLAMKARLEQLINDKDIKLILFPILCVGEHNTSEEKDTRKHMVLFVYNKALGSFEMWDDMYGHTNNHYGLYRLHRQYVSVYLFPILRELGLNITNDAVHLPAYSEKWYLRIKRALTANHFDNNYPPIYAAFLVDYIKRRMKYLNKTCKDLCKDVSMETIARSYSMLFDFTRDWQIANRCQKLNEHRNPMTGKCVKSSGHVVGLENEDACPYPALRNIDTNRCNQKLQIHEHYVNVDENNGSSYLTHDVKQRWGSLMKYLSKKYPYMATTPSNKFVWAMDKDVSKWMLKAPAQFDKLMAKAMSSSRVKYVVFFIRLTDKDFKWAHSNVLLIDKRARTVERFEPNEPVEWEKFANGSLIDKALREVFSPYGLTYIPMEETCPIGFQELEEDSIGFQSNDGNCALWTMWYIELRLANPDVPRLELIKNAWKTIEKEGAFKQFIHGYHDFLRKELKKE